MEIHEVINIKQDTSLQNARMWAAFDALRRGECATIGEAVQLFQVPPKALKTRFRLLNFQIGELSHESSQLPHIVDNVIVELDQNLTCRICLRRNENSMYLFDQGQNADNVLPFAEKMIGFQLEQDETLPDRICTDCAEKVTEFVHFQQMARENQSRLQSVKDSAVQEQSEEEILVTFTDEYPSGPVEIFETEDNPPANFVLDIKQEPVTNESYWDGIFAKFFRFSCEYCDGRPRFDNFGAIQEHTIRVHRLAGPKIPCFQPACERLLKTRAELCEHVWRHTKERQESGQRFECDICQLECGSKADLLRHFELGHDLDGSQSQQAVSALQGGNQMSIETPLPPPPPLLAAPKKEKSRKSTPITSSGPPYTCEACQRQFLKRQGFIEHCKTAHVDASTPRDFRCTVCQKTFLTEFRLTMHFRRYCGKDSDTPTRCQYCQASVASKTALFAHIRDVHRPTKTVNCPYCRKPCCSQVKLKEHLTTHGVGGDLYACAYCDRTFNFSSARCQHIRLHHPLEWALQKMNPKLGRKPAIKREKQTVQVQTFKPEFVGLMNADEEEEGESQGEINEQRFVL